MEVVNTLPGNPFPMGTELRDGGVNFAVYSKTGTKVILDLFHTVDDSEPFACIELDPNKNRTGSVWHVFVPGLGAGALYLYQVDGPFEPSRGERFNVHQYLLDPYAQALTPVSLFGNLPPTYKTPVDKMDVELSKDRALRKFPKCIVVDHSSFDWEGDKPLNRPLADSIIYEAHVRGFTAGKENAVSAPGTYKGFAEKIPHLKRLGITAVEFMPIQEFDEYENANVNPRTGERMKNYWGYSTMAFCAPKATFAADRNPGGSVREFKQLVKDMHREGLEVILDIVFNHTAEGNEHGITFGFRGFENSAYYILVENNKEYYMNYSGCGNSVNCNHPVVRDFIIDCLRGWVLNYHVDGFRFDLASILSRSQQGALLQFPPLPNRISEDPILANTKIIAEPWDAGGAYQLGWFPGGRWAEWNDRFRDDMRRFWRGDEHAATNAATRMSGSSDFFALSGRKPYHSINYITSHDGFTLNDLVSYNGKHNDENGEENHDGSDSNWSYNHGYEGPTANPSIERMRNQKIKSFLLSLMISQGTPMMLAGDEFRRGQQGNNNAYCQDNEISWIDWSVARMNDRLVTFVSRAIALRKAHAVFRRTDFFKGENAGAIPDIRWYAPDGSNPDWNDISRFLAFTLGGSTCTNNDGNPDDDFYVAANSDRHDIVVTLPTLGAKRKWYRVADTSIDADDAITPIGREEELRAQSRYVVPASSLVILIAKTSVS